VSTVMNLRVPKMRGISWLAAESVSFSRRTLLHGVSKFRRNVMSWFKYVLICGCKNFFGFIWRFDVIRPQTFNSETFLFCHQFTIHLNQFIRCEDGVSIFLQNTGTSKESCVLQKPREGLLFEQHTPCRFEDLLRMCNLSSRVKINTKISII